mmetsp:Transcript_28115/g.70565  ORF Transcript_28115/g.70565 Transcript_28115/m.70565 type:complete len:277 (-) Transcript_28115:319-1149(-)
MRVHHLGRRPLLKHPRYRGFTSSHDAITSTSGFCDCVRAFNEPALSRKLIDTVYTPTLGTLPALAIESLLAVEAPTSMSPQNKKHRPPARSSSPAAENISPNQHALVSILPRRERDGACAASAATNGAVVDALDAAIEGGGGAQNRPACPVCATLVQSPAALARHFARAHLRQGALHCKKCAPSAEIATAEDPLPEAFASVEALAAHWQRAHAAAFRCDKCGKGVGTASNLRKHLRNVHEGKRENLCGWCEASFFQKHDLRRHESAVHGRGGEDEE